MYYRIAGNFQKEGEIESKIKFRKSIFENFVLPTCMFRPCAAHFIDTHLLLLSSHKEISRDYLQGSFTSCFPLTFRGDKAASRAEEGTVLLKPKLIIARILFTSSYRTQGLGLAWVCNANYKAQYCIYTRVSSFFHEPLPCYKLE